jgi:hypothetical protein
MWIQRPVQSGFEWICWEIVDLRKKRKMVVRIVGMEAMGNGEGEMNLGLRFRNREKGDRDNKGWVFFFFFSFLWW